MLDRWGRAAGRGDAKRRCCSQREGDRQGHGTTSQWRHCVCVNHSALHGLGTHENPVNLSDAPTEASHTRTCPESVEPIDESKILGHFSDALSEMAESLMDLEDSYFKALYEVIVEMERALRDISHIDPHYISKVVMVMASWQEAVQTAVTNMENADLTINLACWEDTWRVTKEYVAAVIKAREECDAAHTKETEARREVIKASDPKDPVIHWLEASGSEHTEHHLSIPNERVAGGKQWVCLPPLSEALRLVWIGQHGSNYSADLSK